MEWNKVPCFVPEEGAESQGFCHYKGWSSGVSSGGWFQVQLYSVSLYPPHGLPQGRKEFISGEG